jgi:hypothetical protein
MVHIRPRASLHLHLIVMNHFPKSMLEILMVIYAGLPTNPATICGLFGRQMVGKLHLYLQEVATRTFI